MRDETRLSRYFAGYVPRLRGTARIVSMLRMNELARIDVAKLKKAIIDNTGPGKRFSRRGLSMIASGGQNADLVRDLFRGQDRKPTFETVAGIADGLGLNVADFVQGALASQSKEQIWVVGRVQAGVWTEHPEWAESDWYLIDVEPSPIAGAERFALEMVGHSMDRVIPAGSLLECLRVFNREEVIPRNGDVVIVQRTRSELIETTCKRLEITTDGIYILHCDSYREEFSEPVFMGRPDRDTFSDDGTRIIAIVDRATQKFFNRQR